VPHFDSRKSAAEGSTWKPQRNLTRWRCQRETGCIAHQKTSQNFRSLYGALAFSSEMMGIVGYLCAGECVRWLW
jgi:hypothetical protein